MGGTSSRYERAEHSRISVLVRVIGAVLLLAGATAYWTGVGSTAPADQFEITDGNIVDNSQAPAPNIPDWDTIFGTVSDTTGFLTTAFTADPISSDPLPSPPCDANKTGDLTVFTGGSDKNADAIPTWTYQSGSVPQKDDLTNVYAAANMDGTDQIFYFALERAEVDGDAYADFEFLKSPIGLQQGTGPQGPTVDARGCPSGNFTGARLENDILVTMKLQDGGSVGNVEFRKWDGDSYEVFTPTAGEVGFVTNTGTIACGDWGCRDRDGNILTQLPQGAFMEGFINVTQALDTAPGCYSTVIAKTRSSHEWNAELKDFALSEFNTCDAFITITPDGVNEVGDSHSFTGHVEVNPTGTFVNAPDGTQINFTKISGPGTLWAASCLTSGGTGSCSVNLTSSTSGTTVVAASTTVQVGPTQVTRSTNGSAGPGGSGNATKEWVDGYIKVTPDDVNPVNQSHDFTVEFGVLAAGADDVDLVSLLPVVSPTPGSIDDDDCDTPDRTGNVWTCTVTINSTSAGVFDATATGVATVAKTGVSDIVTITRSTTATAKGPGGNEGATKTYVDARIFVGPNGLNEVDDTHTVEGHVQTKDGDGAWTNAPAGTTITFAKESGVGGFVGSDNTCDTVGATGKCTVAIVSANSGTTVVSAEATVTVNGMTLTRTTATPVNTAAGGSGNLTKKWADGSIEIVDDGVNEVNDDHLFTVTVTAHRPASGETVTFDSITPSVTPTPDSAVSTCDSPTVAGDGLSATCTYTINNADADIFDVDASADISFADGVNPKLTITRATNGDFGPIGSDGARKVYVDARVSVGPDGVNAVGDPHEVIGLAEFNDGTGWQPAEGATITFATTTGVGGFVNGTDSCTAGADGRCSVHIVSSEAGVQWVSASTSYRVLGVTLSRTTSVDGPTDPDNLRKEWVSATIDIRPDGVNEVGDPHTFDITVTGTSSGADIVFGTVTTSVTPEPDEMSDTCSADDRTVDEGVLTCTLTINNDEAGIFEANVSVTVTIGGVVFNLTTDGTAGSGPAFKTYVDARISLTPDGVNAVGDPHVMTALLEVNDGEGWGPAVEETVELTLLSGPGELSAADCVTGSAGTCEVTLTSAVAGITEVGASSTVGVGGVTLTRSTNSNAGPGGSDNLVKQWVDASVAISPDGVNPVGADHTFEITVTAIPSETGQAAFSIDPSVTPAPDEISSTCDVPGVDDNVATCVVTISNTSAGVFTAHVTAVVTMGDVEVTRSTDSTVAPAGPGGTGPAEKVYVDASIQVTPDGVNAVGDPHTVTGHVNVDDGTGSADAPDGTTISFEVESGPGSLSATSCATASGTGSCSVTLSSVVAGVTVVSAASTVSIEGVTLDLTSNGAGANSDNLTKRWVDAFITIGPSAVNPLNEPHTFDVAVTAIPSGASPVSFDVITAGVTPEPTSLASTCENPVVTGNTATCTLTINSSSAALFTANATATVSVDGASVTRSTDATVAPAGPGGSGPATKEYVAVAGVVLVRTGIEPFMLVVWGVALLALGANLLLASRWRRAGITRS